MPVRFNRTVTHNVAGGLGRFVLFFIMAKFCKATVTLFE